MKRQNFEDLLDFTCRQKDFEWSINDSIRKLHCRRSSQRRSDEYVE